MMTTKEIRNQFDFYYELECKKRQVAQINFSPAQFLLMYSNSVLDVAKRLKMLYNSTNIDLTSVDVYTEYDLPPDYSGFVKAELFDDSGALISILPEGSYSELSTAPDEVNSTNQKVIIFAKPDGYKLVLSPKNKITGSLTLHYLSVPDIYAPSKGASTEVPIDVDYQPTNVGLPDT